MIPTPKPLKMFCGISQIPLKYSHFRIKFTKFNDLKYFLVRKSIQQKNAILGSKDGQ